MSDLASVPISNVIKALGGPDVRGNRITAFWRDGNGPNVAIDAEHNRWFDHARNEGGGVLSLVRNVTLTDTAGALSWLVKAGFIENRPLPAARRQSPSYGPVAAVYIYADEDGQPVYQVRRHDPKCFTQWRCEGGEWKPGLKGVRRLLYRLPEVIESPIVFIVEGEKDVETLREWGFVATCNSGGAGHWPHEFDPTFAGREVNIIRDADKPGLNHALDVATGLFPHAAHLAILMLPGVKDVTEWFDQGHSEIELIDMVERERTYAT